MEFLILFLIPVIIMAIGSYLTKRIEWKEYLIMTATQAVIAGLCCLAVSCENTSDVEILNGQVTRKQMNRVSCSHSYSCNCVRSCSTDSKGNESCTEICQTCYDHSYDQDWDVYTTLGTMTIDRADRQGLEEPVRWSRVIIGEPVSTSHTYENYIKAAPDTLFRNKGSAEKYKGQIPAYPEEIYDYYRINRLVEVGTNVAHKHKWNEQLSELNKKLGPTHQANVIVVFTKKPHEYFHALRQAWIGGKKNDIIVVIGLKYNSQPVWTEIMAWSQNKTIDVKLRNRIQELEIISPETLIPVIDSAVSQYYKRKPMHDFEYLVSTITPTFGQWMFGLIVGILVAIGQVMFYSQEHVGFGSYSFNSRNRYTRYGR